MSLPEGHESIARLNAATASAKVFPVRVVNAVLHTWTYTSKRGKAEKGEKFLCYLVGPDQELYAEGQVMSRYSDLDAARKAFERFRENTAWVLRGPSFMGNSNAQYLAAPVKYVVNLNGCQKVDPLLAMGPVEKLLAPGISPRMRLRQVLDAPPSTAFDLMCVVREVQERRQVDVSGVRKYVTNFTVVDETKASAEVSAWDSPEMTLSLEPAKFLGKAVVLTRLTVREGRERAGRVLGFQDAGRMCAATGPRAVSLVEAVGEVAPEELEQVTTRQGVLKEVDVESRRVQLCASAVEALKGTGDRKRRRVEDWDAGATQGATQATQVDASQADGSQRSSSAADVLFQCRGVVVELGGGSLRTKDGSRCWASGTVRDWSGSFEAVFCGESVATLMGKEEQAAVPAEASASEVRPVELRWVVIGCLRGQDAMIAAVRPDRLRQQGAAGVEEDALSTATSAGHLGHGVVPCRLSDFREVGFASMALQRDGGEGVLVVDGALMLVHAKDRSTVKYEKGPDGKDVVSVETRVSCVLEGAKPAGVAVVQTYCPKQNVMQYDMNMRVCVVCVSSVELGSRPPVLLATWVEPLNDEAEVAKVRGIFAAEREAAFEQKPEGSGDIREKMATLVPKDVPPQL